MDKEQYQELVKKVVPKEKRLLNCIIAFVVGGCMGMLGTLIYEILTKTYDISSQNAIIWMIIILIGTSSLLTGLGFFDDIFAKGKCGLLIPITGFAHSMTSSCMEYRKEGFITGMGANIFKLVGSVLLYGIFSAFIFTLIKVVFHV